MSLRLAILGLDPLQKNWLEAAATLRTSGEIDLVGVGHKTMAAAKDLSDAFAPAAPPAYDDLRLLLKETAPQVILMDRPENATLDFLLACIAQEIAIFYLGPPVDNLAQAHALAEALEPRTHLLYSSPRFIDSYAYRHCAQADEFVRPIRFVAATWLAMNHALARTAAESHAGESAHGTAPVRSLSVLAWDAFSTLINLIDVPATVYATIRGSVPTEDRFTDISGAASLTLRFPEDAAASLTLSDRFASEARRDLLLLGQAGTLKLEADNYEFRDPDGHLIDAGHTSPMRPPVSAAEALREFFRHFAAPPSPHKGWPHRIVDVAAAMEAMLVSHRTGQAESPESFRQLRR